MIKSVSIFALVLGLFATSSLVACSPTAPLGAHCGSGAQCESGNCNTSGDFPGGICTRACKQVSDCPQGFTCISNSGGICLQSCAQETDCSAYGGAWTCREQSIEASSGGTSGKALVCSGR